MISLPPSHRARDQVAALFPPNGRVIFTGGATEALNMDAFVLHLAVHYMDWTMLAVSYAASLSHLTSYTLHLTPYILHLTPYTLHLTPYTLHLTSDI